MLFNSIDFLLFFPAVVGIYFLFPFKYRWLFLLAASYLFYGVANGWFLLIIILSTLIDYLVGLKMSQFAEKERRKPFLYISLVSNLGTLIIFKYFNFFNDSFRDLFYLLNLDYAISSLNVILPVGISFYTFQTLAYSIDIYNGRGEAEKHFGFFALYVTYFPQLVAGPIERSWSLIPQLKSKTTLTYDNTTNGLKLMVWGFFKKVVIADQIAPMIRFVTDSPEDFYGISVLLCAVLFSYQVYCDFSGYSDIAIGAAQILGVKLMVNFKQPFSAKRLSEFWVRWHISLTTWFKDYVYKEWGGGGKNLIKSYQGLFLVFFLSGLWHGANYTFLLWGTLNGLLIIVYAKFRSQIFRLYKFFGLGKKTSLKGAVQVFFTVTVFSSFGILFFSNNLSQAATLYFNLSQKWPSTLSNIAFNENGSRLHDLYLGYNMFQFLGVILSLIFMEYIQSIQKQTGSFRQFWDTKGPILRWFGYVSVVMLVILYSFDRETPFVYFQF